MWISAGRTLGEKVFLIFEKGHLKAYGFYDLHTQIKTLNKIDALKIPVESTSSDLKNDLQLAILREDIEIIPLPTK